MNYDANKLPLGMRIFALVYGSRRSLRCLLGKLAKSTILNGFAALKACGNDLTSVVSR